MQFNKKEFNILFRESHRVDDKVIDNTEKMVMLVIFLLTVVIVTISLPRFGWLFYGYMGLAIIVIAALVVKYPLHPFVAFLASFGPSIRDSRNGIRIFSLSPSPIHVKLKYSLGYFLAYHICPWWRYRIFFMNLYQYVVGTHLPPYYPKTRITEINALGGILNKLDKMRIIFEEDYHIPVPFEFSYHYDWVKYEHLRLDNEFKEWDDVVWAKYEHSSVNRQSQDLINAQKGRKQMASYGNFDEFNKIDRPNSGLLVEICNLSNWFYQHNIPHLFT